jgi:hypothetical protein
VKAASGLKFRYFLQYCISWRSRENGVHFPFFSSCFYRYTQVRGRIGTGHNKR